MMPTRRRLLLWVLLPLGVLLPCVACSLLLALLDQPSIEANIYFQAVSSGNSGLAEMLEDRFSADKDWHQRFYAQDIQRDVDWLRGKETRNVATTREQTLSGQWATVVRFEWRPQGTNQAWQPVAFRVKTDRWLLLTYVTAVEVVGP